VLVLGMAHHDGTVVAGELYPVAEACGQTPEQVRSCLRRLVKEGLFVRSGEGREARYGATAAGMRSLQDWLDRTRIAYSQDAAGKGWDGTWRMVAFAIPESKRTARDTFRAHLTDLGGATIHNGLYVSPHPWKAEVEAEAARLGVAEHLTFATTNDLEVGGETSPRKLAEQLWPVAEVADRYQRFLDIYAHIPDALEQMRRQRRRLTEAEYLPGALVIGIKFTECFNADPLLPPELLPRPWPGRAARDVLVRCRRLGTLLRAEHNKPQLFGLLDEVLGSLV
jgi:phenylacetic acid degradation operon negative regulatory protein